MSITVYNVERLSATQVRLTTSNILQNSTHILTVSNVKNLSGITIDPAHDSLTTVVPGLNPSLLSATITEAFALRLVFSQPMSSTGINTVGNYNLSGPTSLTIASITIVDAATIDIIFNEEMRIDGAYSIVASGVKDLADHFIDPHNDTLPFDGQGVAPQVSSTTKAGDSSIAVVFSEAVDETLAEDSDNYTISGAGSPEVTGASLGVDNVTVTLTLGESLGFGTYNVLVEQVEDLVGNLIDPDYDTGSLTINAPVPLIQGGWSASAQTYKAYQFREGNWELVHHYPSVRSEGSLVYDSTHDLAIYVNGRNLNMYGDGYRDTWEYDGSTITKTVDQAGPWNYRYSWLGCYEHAACYDSVNDRTVVFGGRPYYVYEGGMWVSYNLDATWVYNSATNSWTEPGPSTKPRKRYTCSGHMTFNPVDGKCVLVSGMDTNWPEPGSTYLEDVWTYDVATNTWTDVTPVGTKPSGRAYASVVYYPPTQQIILFGGIDSATAKNNDMWALDCTTYTWTDITPVTRPGIRGSHQMVYDIGNSRLLLYGGYNTGVLQDTWVYDGAWTMLNPATTPDNVYKCAMSLAPVHSS